MKKKILGIVFAVALVLSIGAVAYAATGGFTMTYLPGTSDTVADMPSADSGTGGQVYTVSSTVPQREGYEFIDWTLDYELAPTYTLTYKVTGDPVYGFPDDALIPDTLTDICEGSNVTLAGPLTTEWTTADGSAPPMETYKVNYLELGTNKQLAPQKSVSGNIVGTIVTEDAIDISGYLIDGDDSQTKSIRQTMLGRWTFSGWCSDEACTTPITEVSGIMADTTIYSNWKFEWIAQGNNEFNFYYGIQPKKYISYTVRYIDIMTNEMIIDDRIRYDVEEGDIVTEYPMHIDGYIPLDDYIIFQPTDNTVLLMLYYPDYDVVN